MRILTCNAGSSSLKCSLFEKEGEKRLAEARAEWSGSATEYSFAAPDSEITEDGVSWSGIGSALERVLSDLREQGILEISAVAHRVVHGGNLFIEPVVITDEVADTMRELGSLAPLHNPGCLKGIEVARRHLNHCRHVAVFDTAFHVTLPPEAYIYPLPFEWTEKWKLRRFGFHGLSHSYCAAKSAELLDRPLEDLNLIIAHLGHGASLAAIREGRSADTTMGFTPLEGLMMATRSGTVDPGLLLHLARERGVALGDLNRILNEESGLLGVSGVSSDMREVRRAAKSGNSRARLALSIYVHRLRQGIAAMAATLGRVDALVFTGGVGERDEAIREESCRTLSCLGLELDSALNHRAEADAFISKASSSARILVIATDEELMLSRAAKETVGKLDG